MAEPNQPAEPSKTPDAAPTPAPAPPPPADAGQFPPAMAPAPPPPAAVQEERIDRLRRKQQKMGRVPSLRHDQGFVPGTPARADQDELERELEEAMAGMSDQQIYAEPAPRPQQPGQPGTGRQR